MIGQRVKNIRIQKGLSVSELARAADVSQEWLYKLENDKYESPGIESLKALSRALDVPLMKIVAEKEAAND